MTAPGPEADRDLLRRFEPVLRFTRGERFFPMDVADYVREASLWRQRPGEPPERLLPEESLTLERLAEPRSAGFGSVLFLRFIEPLNLADLARFLRERRRQRQEETFVAGRGRLARVGYGSRIVDSLFSLTLLARGRVPGDMAAAAELVYRQLIEQNPVIRYYGRVVRENHWIVLQYWFFYAYNNWRSGFFGVNDHEADWEQVCVYAYEAADGTVRPAWVAFASHDFVGDDLRRRWDDPEVVKIAEHPVVYVGAGSHASYFRPGEYLAEIELPFLRPLVRLVDRFNRARDRALAEYWGDLGADRAADADFNLFRIPFVDYARGDGRAVGPGQGVEWDEPVLLDPAPGWALHYRGLWGLYARDPLSGEDAPAGPVYNRDGTVRQAWYDPLGWAGLNKVPPPSRALEALYERQAEVLTRRRQLADRIEAIEDELMRLGIGAQAMRGMAHLRAAYDLRQAEIAALSAELNEAHAEYARDAALVEALEFHANALENGERGPLRAHINRGHQPIENEALRLGRLAEFWAAISIGLILIAIVALAAFSPERLWVGLAVILGLFLLLESAFRAWLGRLITFATLVLALISAVVLLIRFFWYAVIAAVLIVGVYLMWENIRELRR